VKKNGPRILALAGGVGGARLAHGLAQSLAPRDLVTVVNTGDDFQPLGLHVSPDLDTVMYTLAGLSDPVQGWGLKGETWSFLAGLERLGGDAWFRLGDQDLATHIERTRRLGRESLSQITADFCRRLGVRHAVEPMSDDPVRTLIDTDQGLLSFQDYFVRARCRPRLRRVVFRGARTARPSSGFLAALNAPRLEAILICPSNPFLSIDPILALPGVRAALKRRLVPIVAVSPLIGGKAVKGPAGKILSELRLPPTPATIAGHYGRLLDGLVIDRADAGQAAALGRLPFLLTDTLMRDEADRRRLGAEVLTFARSLRA
jgi:LPPG:FO 2-phospho-L-lactate transferase